MRRSVKILDLVALIEDLPAQRLYQGQVGTVVEILAPGVYEVEFVDQEGQTYAMEVLKDEQLLLLHYEAIHAAYSSPEK